MAFWSGTASNDGRGPNQIWGKLVVYKRYVLSRVRHDEPFNKTQRGKARRAERRFKLEQREAGYDATDYPFNPAANLHRKTRYGTP